MNVALVFAGGTGQRMNTRAKPKQFLELYGKPIILYTLDFFEEHPEIDDIIVVCLENWMAELRRLLDIHGFEKVTKIVPGGSTGHESIYLGLAALENFCVKEDIVLIHDGVRPLITSELITANIEKVKECGTAITVESAAESIIESKNGDLIDRVPPRGSMYMAKAPQSFRYGMIWDLYKRAKKDGYQTIDSSHLLSIYGVESHLIKSSPNNMKITAPLDFYIFRALYEAKENQQILGI